MRKRLCYSFFIELVLPYTPKDDTQQKLIYREIVLQ